MNDERWMGIALAEAEEAAERGDIPIGAALVHDSRLLAASGNRRDGDFGPLGHAETLVIVEAARRFNRRLDGCTLYVTVEPCPMCAGAIVESRIARVVFGAREPRSGAVRSLYQLLDDPRRAHRVEVAEGVRASEAARLLQSFFQSRRR